MKTKTTKEPKTRRPAAVRASVASFIEHMRHACELAESANTVEPRQAAAYLVDMTWDLFECGTIPRLSRDARYE